MIVPARAETVEMVGHVHCSCSVGGSGVTQGVALSMFEASPRRLQPCGRSHTPRDRIRQPQQAALPKSMQTRLIAPVQQRMSQLRDTSLNEAAVEKAEPA
jgi:hypothetical protein